MHSPDVLGRAKRPFRASLLWLVDMGAVTLEQADRLDVIYAHRNELTHELMKYIVDPDAEPDVALLVDALSILKSIRRFWTSVEADYGTFDDFPGVDLDEVVLGSMMVLQLCLDAYVEGQVAPEGE